MQASDAPDRILQKNLQNYNKIYKQAIKCFNWKPQKNVNLRMNILAELIVRKGSSDGVITCYLPIYTFSSCTFIKFLNGFYELNFKWIYH